MNFDQCVREILGECLPCGIPHGAFMSFARLLIYFERKSLADELIEKTKVVDGKAYCDKAIVDKICREYLCR